MAIEIAGCACKGVPGNSGNPTGVKPFGKTVVIVRVPLRATDGTRNCLDLTSPTLGQDYLDKVNHPDPSKRWYPFNDVKSVTYEEADPLTQTLEDGSNFITGKGVKKVAFAVYGVSEQYFNKTSEMCSEEGLVAIDLCGNMRGQLEGTNLYPRPLNEQSFFAKYMDATDTVRAHVSYTVDYSLLTNDGNQWMLTATNFSDVAGLNPVQVYGMIDVRWSIVTVDSTTQVTVLGLYDYGDAALHLPWLGALPADFTLTNKTTPAVLVPSLADPDPVIKGQYQLTFTLQPAGNLIDVDSFRAATISGVNGFEGIEAEFTAI